MDEAAVPRSQLGPGDGELHDGERARPEVRVPVAGGEPQHQLLQAGVVPDQQQRARVRIGAPEQLRQLVGVGLVDVALEFERRLRRELRERRSAGS
jgi:hypothetical protein